MTTDVVSVGPDATADHCAHLMEERRVKRLPVLQDDQLIGVVSRADLLRAVLEPPGRIGTAAEARDQRIYAALRAEMRAQPWADDLYTYAEVRDGVVTLHGFVRSAAMRRGLRVLAERIDGVERVEDRLQEWIDPGERRALTRIPLRALQCRRSALVPGRPNARRAAIAVAATVLR